MSLDSHTADRLTGLVLLVLGIAMLAGGYTMDRLEIRQIHPASIPGLVPMGLGIAMIICSTLLIISAGREAGKGKVSNDTASKPSGSWSNLLVSIVLCVGYAMGLLGQMPFALATGIFIFLFALYFSWPDVGETSASRLRLLAFIAVFAAVFSAAISLLFRYGFLVRLP